MNKSVQILLSIVPLLLTPPLVFLIGGGVLNFGSGEKDILWAFVWALWATLFALSSLVLIYRNWHVGDWIRRSALVATAVLLVLWVFLLIAGEE